MCGIFGLALSRPHSDTELAEKLEAGCARLRHRGPDGEGTWIAKNGKIGLGHLRLSIIDLASGQQPMASFDGRYVLTFNGEIYNYIELREEIGVENFRTTSDTEVILRAYEKWGEDCVSHFRGMFAFAIWDNKEETLFLARDRFGIKPLYWAQTSEGLFFASEVKALLPFLPEVKANEQAVADYFTFQFCLGSKTLTDGVHQLPAAHYAVLGPDGSFAPKRYWEVNYITDFDHDEAWFVERLRELLYESVSFHLRADVEVGAYASGGVDSSLLAAISQGMNRDTPLKIFNGRFTDGPAYDESRYAQDLATENGMDIFIRDISESDFADVLPKLIWHMDQPNAGPGSFPQYMVSEMVREHVKVVLGGQGGDEIFGGYARYLVGYMEEGLKGAINGIDDSNPGGVPFQSIVPNLKTLNEYKPLIREFWADNVFGNRDDRYWRLVNRANKFSGIIDPYYLNNPETRAEFGDLFNGANVQSNSYFDEMTHLDFKTLLPALLQVEDRMSMAHGVEARVPFLDHKLVEFAATIPASVKYKDGELKRMLKLTFSSELPKSIVNRKDKMGFPVPLNQWLQEKGQTRELIGDIFSSNKASTRNYLNGKFNVDEVIGTDTKYTRNLWALLGLEIWHQQFVDGNYVH